MRSFWSDPFLWIHLAGFAALPLWLELCWLGLAAGNPVLPFWLELLVVAAIGIAPVFWMQWQRPFYIFSLIAVGLKPAQLTEDQRRLLTLFQAQRNRILAIAAAITAFFALRQLYYLAPIAAPVTPFPAESRWLGVLVAAIAFLGVNLFLQVPLSVLSVMLTGESAFAATTPYPLEQIQSDFTLLGIPVNQILPPVIAVTPTTIPDAELERVADEAAAEPTTTEEDLEADLWDVETAIAPDSTVQETVNPSVESKVTAIAEDSAESVDTIHPEAIAHETSIDSVTVINVEDSVPAEGVGSSEEMTRLEDIADATSTEPEVIDNSVEAVRSEAGAEPEEVTPAETIANAEEFASPAASDNAETISAAEDLVIVEEVNPSVLATAEEVDISAAIADSEEPGDFVEIVSSEASTSSEAIANSDASTDSETTIESEATTQPDAIADVEENTQSEVIADVEATTPTEAIADAEVPPDDTAAVEPVETLNPDMVASAPTEAPAPNAGSPSSIHHAPEDHKE